MGKRGVSVVGRGGGGEEGTEDDEGGRGWRGGEDDVGVVGKKVSRTRQWADLSQACGIGRAPYSQPRPDSCTASDSLAHPA